MIFGWLEDKYPNRKKLIMIISAVIDITLYALILYVWFFGIKEYCTPQAVCPEVLRSCGQLVGNIGNFTPGAFNSSSLMVNITPVG